MKKQTENTTQNTPPTGRTSGSVPGAVVTGDLSPVKTAPVTTVPGTDIDMLTRLQKENDQLKTTIRLSAAHQQIMGELLKAGARSPELLFDSVRGDLQFAEDGKVTNATAIVEKLKSGFPEQFGYTKPVSIDGGAGRASGNTLTREALAKMKPAEIAELDWADVRRVLAGS